MTDQSFKPGITALASGLFCWLADMLLYPIDTISTRLKGNKTNQSISIRSILNLMKNQTRSLYRGISLTFPHSFISTSVYIYIYENLMHHTSRLVDKVTTHKQVKLIFPFFISTFCQGITLLIELPFDTIRTRIQMNLPEYQYSSIRKGLQQIYKTEGIFRFYKSVKIYFLTHALHTGLQFQFYETFNYYYGHVNKYMTFLNALLSAIFATAIINPLSVVITRYALVDTTRKKLVFKSVVEKIWQKEGLSGFYKGVTVEMILASGYSVIWMPAFQYMRNVYGVNLKQ